MDNKKENKLNTIKMEIFYLNLIIKIEKKKENKLDTMIMEKFYLNLIIKMENKKENKLDTMKMEKLLNFIINIIITIEKNFNTMKIVKCKSNIYRLIID